MQHVCDIYTFLLADSSCFPKGRTVLCFDASLAEAYFILNIDTNTNRIKRNVNTNTILACVISVDGVTEEGRNGSKPERSSGASAMVKDILKVSEQKPRIVAAALANTRAAGGRMPFAIRLIRSK